MRLPAILIRSSLPLWILVLLVSSCATTTPNNDVIRVGVIGGMMRSGVWPEIAKRFEEQRGFRVEVVASGNRDLVADAFRKGKLDVATMHAGEVASNLVAEGFARNMRVWTRNEFVIVGPPSDPAHIRGLRDGAAAVVRIAPIKAPFVDYQNSGPRDVAAALWEKARIEPQGNWLLETESGSSEEALEFARRKQAYVVLGRIPSLVNTSDGHDMEILVQGDPEMHRSFVVLEASRFAGTNVRGARALGDYLLSAETQQFLLKFASNSPAGVPLFFPVKRR